MKSDKQTFILQEALLGVIVICMLTMYSCEKEQVIKEQPKKERIEVGGADSKALVN